jgi:CysZ protein
VSESRTGRFFMVRFARGFAHLPRAVGLIVGSRRILLLSLVPFLICLAIYVGFLVAALSFAPDLADRVIAPGAWWRSALRLMFITGLIAVSLVILVFTYASACFVIAAPFYEFLSAAVERKVTGGIREEPFSVRSMLVDVWRALVGAVVILAIEVGVLAFGLLLGPVTAAAAVLVSAVLLSLEYLDYPMGRRRMPLKEKFRFARRHAWEFLGLGLPMLVGLAVPFVGVVFLPVGVVGGTLLFVDLTRGADPD